MLILVVVGWALVLVFLALTILMSRDAERWFERWCEAETKAAKLKLDAERIRKEREATVIAMQGIVDAERKEVERIAKLEEESQA